MTRPESYVNDSDPLFLAFGILELGLPPETLETLRAGGGGREGVEKGALVEARVQAILERMSVGGELFFRKAGKKEDSDGTDFFIKPRRDGKGEEFPIQVKATPRGAKEFRKMRKREGREEIPVVIAGSGASNLEIVAKIKRLIDWQRQEVSRRK